MSGVEHSMEHVIDGRLGGTPQTISSSSRPVSPLPDLSRMAKISGGQISTKPAFTACRAGSMRGSLR